MINLTGKKIVALTGMSGAGKSTVCKLFEANCFFIIDCDKVSREVAEIGQPALAELAERLSADLIKADGSLDRRKTAELIFNDDDKRALFNRIIYPYITYNIVGKIRSCDKNILLDAPTVFEADLQGMCDRVVSVCADTEICVERIMKRDNIPEELAKARLSSQHGIDFFRKNTDYCIENNGTEAELFQKAEEIISDLLKGD